MISNKEDLFVRLIDSSLSEDEFLKIKQERQLKTSNEELKLGDCKFKLSLSFITIEKKDLKSSGKYELIKQCVEEDTKNEEDKLDIKLFGEESPYSRSIYVIKKPIEFEIKCNSESNTIYLKLYISESKLKTINGLYLITYTLTDCIYKEDKLDNSYNCVSLSNKELIVLSNYFAFLFKYGDLKDILSDKKIKVEENELNTVDGVDRFIQFICFNECNTKNDVRDIIKKPIRNKDLTNLYYFFSILTHDYTEGLYRRHLNNIKSVMEYCHTISEAYFNVISGNVCLEITNKPNKELFSQIGHDSEEFRIWEMLVLQKHILDNDDYLELTSLKELDDFYNLRMFTKKLEKGNNWINYANYLKDITRVEYLYNIRKNELLLEEKEKNNKLKKLNLLIIVSIFISVVTFLLSPLYSEKISYNVSSESLKYNYFINNGYGPEISAIILGATISLICYYPINNKIGGILKNRAIQKYVGILRKGLSELLNKFKSQISSKLIFILFVAIILLIIIKYSEFIYKIIQGIS